MFNLKCKIFICIVPFALAFIEMFHPYGFSNNVYKSLLPVQNIWLCVHICQLFLLPAIAAVFFIIIQGINGSFAFCTRLIIILFAILYTAYDSIAGIGTGILLKIGKELPLNQQELIQNIVQKYFFDPSLGGSHSLFSESASLAALLSIWFVALILWKKHYPKLTILIYFLAGPILWYSHAFPYGPIAFSLIGCANLWLIFRGRSKNKEKITNFNS